MSILYLEINNVRHDFHYVNAILSTTTNDFYTITNRVIELIPPFLQSIGSMYTIHIAYFNAIQNEYLTKNLQLQDSAGSIQTIIEYFNKIKLVTLI